MGFEVTEGRARERAGLTAGAIAARSGPLYSQSVNGVACPRERPPWPCSNRAAVPSPASVAGRPTAHPRPGEVGRGIEGLDVTEAQILRPAIAARPVHRRGL
jgi:hypothetical protein